MRGRPFLIFTWSPFSPLGPAGPLMPGLPCNTKITGDCYKGVTFRQLYLWCFQGRHFSSGIFKNKQQMLWVITISHHMTMRSENLILHKNGTELIMNYFHQN